VDACVGMKRGVARTGNIALARRRPALKAAGLGSEGLVARGQGDDGEEGEEQAWRAPDVPPSEDDAEVGGVPGKEHLRGRRLARGLFR
jgi:hypothetical protein